MNDNVNKEIELNIRAVYAKSEEERSRVVIDVTGSMDINLREYVLHDNTFNDNDGISNLHEHYYRFPIGSIATPGSIVRVFAEKGSSAPIKTVIKGTTYFDFYWGMENIWNENDTAYLLRVAPVSKKGVQKIEKK